MSTNIGFVADENIDAAIVARLRADGRDILWIAEFEPGADDDRVLEIALSDSRLLITADHDFGDLVFRLGRATSGILLVRLEGLSAERKANLVSAAVAAHDSELLGNFTVLAPTAMRIRKP